MVALLGALTIAAAAPAERPSDTRRQALPDCSARSQDRCVQRAATRSDDLEEPSHPAEAAAKAFIQATSTLPARRAAPLSMAMPTARSSAGPSLGLAFAITAYGAQIIAVMPGSPAQAAGIVPGKLVTAVNGVSLAGVSPDDAVALVRSPARSVTYGFADGGGVTLVRPAG